MKKICLFILLFLCSMSGFAQEFEKPFKILDQEIIDKYKSLYKDQETGDSYDPASGSVTFAVTDISIPGNSSIPVELSRWIPSDDLKTFALGGGWYWDIPVIKANYMNVNPHISTGGMGTITLSQDGWYGGKNCSQTFSQQVLVSNRELTHFVESWFYWEGKQLHIPNKTTEKFLEANETTPFVSNVQITKSNYKVIECIQLENNQEGFVVKGPDGTTYTFGKVKSYYTGAAPPTSYSPLTTFTKLIMVTEIKDRFGNTVTYEYNGPDNLLSAIVGSDGRRIDITYKAYSFKGTVYYIPDFAEANEKKWTYAHSSYIADPSFPTETRRILTRVNLPDGSYWSYSSNLGQLGFSPLKDHQVSNHRPDTGENVPGLCQIRPASDINAVVKSPEGLKTEYKFKLTYHGRSKVAPETQMSLYVTNVEHLDTALVAATFSARNLNCSVSFSLKEKKITGTGIVSQTWQYDYSQNTGTYTVDNPVWAGPSVGVIDGGDLNQLQTGSSAITFLNGQPGNIADAEDYRTTTVTGPDSKSVYYIDRRFLSPTEGSIVAEDSLNKTSNSILARTETTSTKADYIGRHWLYRLSSDGPSLNSINSNLIQYRINKTQQKTSFYYEDGTDTYTTAYGDYDSLGFSGKVSESNNFSSYQRYTKNGYIHDQTRWILGLPTTTQISADDSSYTTVKELVYHSADNTDLYEGLYLPYEYKSYGTWVRRYPDFLTTGQVGRIIYNQPRLNASGSVAANSYRFQYFSSYKRGKAQSISPPLRYSASGGMSFSRVINDDGLTTSITDLNGVTATYDYDLVGRLKSVDLPGSWLDTSIEWQEPASGPIKRIGRSCTLNADKSGCESDSLTFESTSEYDALYRILKSGDKDVSNNINRHQNVAYNSLHQPTFTSFKSESATEAQGTTNAYDHLGRLTSVTLSNGGTVTRKYLSGNKIKATDAEGNETTTTYLAYGSQDYSKALTVSAPEGITTSNVINIFGDLTSTTQTGPGKDGIGTLSLTEYRAYDAMHYLCKVSRSDVGTTVFSNNLLGEVQWKAQGVSGGTVTDCTSDANDNNKIYFTYDNMGDLWKVNYPDNDVVTAPDITYTRDKNGNINTIQVGNITQLYNYNELSLLEDEALQVNGKYFKLDYDYNAAGQLAHLTYPDGSKVSFSPNAFGESQSVIRDAEGEPFTYVNDVSYYPNGHSNTFTYGNGLTHKTTLNSRQLPESVKDSRSGFNALYYSYTYNNNSHITSLIDHVDSSFSITNFAYDGVGRLTGTTGNTGIGSSTMRYDGLDNITYYKNKKHILDYTYSATNRLQSVASSGVESKPYDLFAYDDRGNVTHNSYHDFIYNRANQLVESGGNLYTYDANNRRVVTKQGAKTTYSFYSQSGKLFYTETDGGGINYVYLGSRLIAKDGVIPENGNKQHYLPFGASIEGEINDVGYTGHKFDKDIGLSYMQARYYDPVLGRFMSPDPIGSADQFNLFAYVGNNPVNRTDPSGMCWIFTPICLALTTGGATATTTTAAAGVAGIGTTELVATAVVVGTVANAASVQNMDDDTGGDGGNVGAPKRETAENTPSLGIIVLAEGKKPTDSGKNSKHGDGGRAKTKAATQIEKLKEKVASATGSEKKKLEQKIKNIEQTAKDKAKGEEHSRRAK